MTCYHPLNAWVHKTRKSNTGKSIVVFSAPSNINDFRSIQVPCGQCIGCRLDYSRDWALRCMHEAQMHEKNCFVTLTYDNDHVPWSKSSGEQTLVKRDLQLFWKSLRKRFPDDKIRYFACGEYGGENCRPHYHAIIFGFDFPDKLPVARSNVGFTYYMSPSLVEVWKRGQCTIADVSFDTCAYVARYCVKKLSGDYGKEVYNGIQKEFVVMSRKPGIAYDWFQKYGGDVFPYDECVLSDGGRVRHLGVPRYYDYLYGVNHELDLQRIKDSRIKALEKYLEEDSVVGRLDQREEFKKLQTKCLQRSLK